MSAAEPTTRANPAPRWSVVRPAGLEPALMSGLPDRTAMVCVGPPLLASGPSIGSVFAGRLLLPVIVAPAWLRIRLKSAVIVPDASGDVAAVLLATTVLTSEM